MNAPDPLASVRAGYNRWAAVYDHDMNPLPALEGRRMQDALGDVRSLDALDLGCGTGRHTAWLAAARARVTAVDFSEAMLAEARRKLVAWKNVSFVAHDLHDPLPFADAAFHVAVSGLVLEHLRDLDAFFLEIRRVLRSNGRAVLSSVHPKMFERGSQARFTDPESGEIVQPGSLPHQIEDFTGAAARAGLRVEKVGEYAPDAAFAARYPRAEKYIDWPMLVVLQLRA